MQSLDDQPNDEEKLEKLDEDNDTPFSPPDDVQGQQIPKDDPRKDSDVDEDEWYSEGEQNATSTQDDEDPDEDAHAHRVA